MFLGLDKSYKNISICSILKILAKIILIFYDNNDNFAFLCAMFQAAAPIPLEIS